MASELRQIVPVSVRRAVRRRRDPARDRPYSACYAPSVLLYFQPNGDVRACCRNMGYPLGNIGEQRLAEIWEGPRRHELMARLAQDDYSHGCQGCKWEIDNEGREGSYPQTYEDRANHLTADPASGAWPRSMEFNLSNSCNLQCIQCNGDLSSSIRLHREKRPPMPKVYGDEFFEDLARFLPHLHHVQFAGGEPFLGAENYRAWALIAEVAPDLEVQVVTNATQWNRRVETVLEQVRVAPTFSLDGITAATYEGVRHGAHHDEVMANVERFCAYARRVGTQPTINFCLMAQNHHEFGPLLVFAEERGIRVDVSVVHYPEHCSIARLDPARIADIHRSLLAQSDDVLARLDRNAGVWTTEVARVGSWLEGHDPGTDHERLWGAADAGPFSFPKWADRQQDDTQARADLAAFAPDAVLHVLSLGEGDAISECPEATAHGLGTTPDELVGAPLSRVQDVVERTHGPMIDQHVLGDGPDRIDVVSVFGDVEIRTVIVAMRDATGFADHARVLFASRPAVGAR